jgi:hypothetical protein
MAWWRVITERPIYVPMRQPVASLTVVVSWEAHGPAGGLTASRRSNEDTL